MVSTLHEALVEMFKQRPALAAELVSGVLGVTLPSYGQARLEPAESTDLTPTEYRADAVVVLADAEEPLWAVVVEVQLGRDTDKRWTWPVYQATLRARLRCPTILLIVCVDATAAAWCAAPIELDPCGSTVVPLVLGPDRVPVLATAEAASRDPELAVLSAMAHGQEPGGETVLDALMAALSTVDEQRSTLYSAVVLAALPTAARRYLEALMSVRPFEYPSEFVRRFVVQGRAEGRAEAKATAVLAVLDARGVGVSEDERARIAGCVDLDQLDVWVRRAAVAESVDDLLG